MYIECIFAALMACCMLCDKDGMARNVMESLEEDYN